MPREFIRSEDESSAFGSGFAFGFLAAVLAKGVGRTILDNLIITSALKTGPLQNKAKHPGESQ